MHIVLKKETQSLLRKLEQEEQLGTLVMIMQKSVFERNIMEGLDCFCLTHNMSQWSVLV